MRRFKNILVGVDLSHGDRLVAQDLAPPSEEAVRRAVWLAGLNNANLHFFFALDVGSRTHQLIESSEGFSDDILARAREVLGGIVSSARRRGIEAECSVVIGKSWLELIRQVLRREHDLLIVGTRHLGRVQGALIGSTGMKLLRKCPCPVWITQPRPGSKLKRVLAATDFSPVCDVALELAASMAGLNGAELHVLHVFEFPEKSHFRELRRVSEEYLGAREHFEREARDHLQEQLARQALNELREAPTIHFITGDSSEVIQQTVEELKVDLLVIGTIARGGISGLLIGNTVERLLPELSCSVLAVKPEEFRSPVKLN